MVIIYIISGLLLSDLIPLVIYIDAIIFFHDKILVLVYMLDIYEQTHTCKQKRKVIIVSVDFMSSVIVSTYH